MQYILNIFLLASITFSTSIFGQNLKMILPNKNSQEFSTNKGSKIITSESSGTLIPSLIKDDWGITLKNFSAVSHNDAVSKEAQKALKDAANARRKILTETPHPLSEIKKRSSVAAPQLLNNFRGNIRDNGIPMDNSMAVSRNGFIVSAINSNVLFTRPDGKVTFRRGFADFFKLLGLGTRMFDPRVIYDAVENKFIVVCLHGSEPSNSYICIAFSKTEDPNGEWSYFKIKGNPSGDDVWFDFPNLSLSDKDFYIGGNMFTSEGSFQYSVIFQIDKNSGYDGAAIDYKYYNNLRDVNGNKIFNPVPVMSGWKNYVDPGMYFISNNFGSSNRYHLNFTTESLYNDPELKSLLIIGPQMTFPPDARQKGIATLLDTGGTRIRSAIYLDGIIHFGSQVGTPTGDVGIFYGRLNLAEAEVTSTILTDAGKDYAYPTFTSFGSTESDSTIHMNYVVSGPDMYGSQAQRVCTGTRSNFEWSDETMLKEGLTPIGAADAESTRWGDYTGATRRFINDRIESWATGSYGENRNLSTWLGQLVTQTEFYSKPIAEFVSDKTTTSKDTLVTFDDITFENATAWTWTFENGTPATSSEKNPSVVWSENGSYDVKLVVTTDLGTDSITKIDYIHIQDPIVKPVAAFSLSRDTIIKGDSVLFTNLSSDNAVRFKWTFVNGNPATSTLPNPTVTYTKTGTFLVSLTAENSAGTNTKVVSKAITVLSNELPVVNFTADKVNVSEGDSIKFLDLTSGIPTQRLWYFTGGNPSTSTEKSPLIRYDAAGVYDVSLKATNNIGSDSIIKTGFINVGTVASQDISLLSNITLYPNPVSTDKVTIDFELLNSRKIQFRLIDAEGKLVKLLYDDKVKQGKNQFSFQSNMLQNGKYFVQILDHFTLIKTLPFIVLK